MIINGPRILRRPLLILALVITLGSLSSCFQEEVDDVKPIIDLEYLERFPVNCDTLYLGEAFTFKARFEDNFQLGGFSIDVHHNFDQHTHSTESGQCEFSPTREPVNPFQYTMDFEIPEGLTLYEAEVQIEIPESTSAGLVDEGDYHLFIRLTDREGWSAQSGLSVKILRQE